MPLDPAALIQLLTGQPPLIALVVFLLIQVQRQQDASLKVERQYGEAVLRERQERVKFSDDIIKNLLEANKENANVSREYAIAMTRHTEQLSELKSVFQREISDHGRDRRQGNG